LDIDRRFLTNAEGDTTLRSPPSALHTCSPISYIALNDCELVRGLNRRCSPSRQNDASAGVCVRHCITAFMKHVFAEVGEAAANLADGRPRHADALARVERVRDDDAARGTLRG
jgi:hypothetical protein